MESENAWMFERMKLYELTRQYPDWSLRRYAREVGHDVQWVRRWIARFRASVPVTLETLRSRSRAPHHRRPRIHEDAKQIVGDLRRELSEQFHRPAGARTIQYGLKQYARNHEVPFTLPKACSTITQILHELGWILPRLPALSEPLDLPAPMEEWEMDFGEIFLGEDGVFEFLLVIDRGTSRLVYLEGSQGYSAETALEAVARLFERCGLPKRLRFDRDPRLFGAWTRDSYPSPLVRFLRVLGVNPVICPPRRPDKKPFVERCIGTLKHEWLLRRAPTSYGEALDALASFPHYYNFFRPHQGRACQNQPPAVAFPVLPSLPQLPHTVSPDAWLKAYHTRVYRRCVNSSGTIQIDRHTYFVGTPYAKQLVLVQLDAERKRFYVTVEAKEVKQLPVHGLLGEPMDFTVYLTVMRAEARTIEAHRRLMWEQTGHLD